MGNQLEEKSFDSALIQKTNNSVGANGGKQYPQIQEMNSTGSKFNQIIVPSASSKRSHKVTNNQTIGSNQASNRRKNNSQNTKGSFGSNNTYIAQGSSQAADLTQLIKKREKMNKSAMDQLNDPLIN